MIEEFLPLKILSFLHSQSQDLYIQRGAEGVEQAPLQAAQQTAKRAILDYTSVGDGHITGVGASTEKQQWETVTKRGRSSDTAHTEVNIGLPRE
jgi:hypothetical protein